MALAWPMVAVLGILCATALIQMYVPAKRELAEQKQLIANARVVAEMAQSLARATSDDLKAIEKERGEMKARLGTLELSGLGRRTG